MNNKILILLRMLKKQIMDSYEEGKLDALTYNSMSIKFSEINNMLEIPSNENVINETKIMNWTKDKNKLIHGMEYLVCLDPKNETYSLNVYYKFSDGDINFKEEGFYWFDSNEDIYKYTRVQPKFWMYIVRPNE